jgi:hypothetical protein
VRAWRAWQAASGIEAGPAFRAVDRHGRMRSTRLSDRAVADMVKRRATTCSTGCSARRCATTTRARSWVSAADGAPFTEAAVDRMLTSEPMASPGAACLALAWQHRELLASSVVRPKSCCASPGPGGASRPSNPARRCARVWLRAPADRRCRSPRSIAAPRGRSGR